MSGPHAPPAASSRRPSGRLASRATAVAALVATCAGAPAAFAVLDAFRSLAAAAPTTGSPASTAVTAPTTTTTTTTTSAAAPPRASKLTTPDQWLLAAIAAEEKVGSVRVDGKVIDGKVQILLDLVVNGDGEGGGVFVQDQSLVKVERVGTVLYLLAPKRFWAAHATAAQTAAYGGKWLALDATDTRFASFDQFLYPTALVVSAFRGHTAPFTMGRPTTFAGHRVVVVKCSTTANGARTNESMYIGRASPHDVYKIVEDTPTEAGTIAFSHYGKAVPLTVPPEPLNLTNAS